MKRTRRKKVLIVGALCISVVFIIIGAFFIREYRRFPEVFSFDRIRSLPYLGWTPAGNSIAKRGVVKYDRARAFPGLNLYSNDPSSGCYLVDMSGNVVHTWSTKESGWHSVKMCANGDLMAIVPRKALIAIGWDSRVKLIRNMSVHHDAAVAQNKDIYALIDNHGWAFKYFLPFPVRKDYLVLMSADGQMKKEISLYDLFRDDIPFKNLIDIYVWLITPGSLQEMKKRRLLMATPGSDYPPDLMHANSVQVIDRDIAGVCKRGNVLVSLSRLDLVAIIDAQEEKIVWKWGPGALSKQHHPVLLENGNILIFDNGVSRKYSRVIELDPLTKTIVWEYKADPADTFYSYTRGASQRLPNGNTLITESDKGHVFEVTRDGEIVWEFYAPQVKEEDRTRATIYRMTRITEPQDYPCLDGLNVQ